ncbi:MAG: EAL domain-containing protein [Chloroflexi bacterium]|nr:EAL domain-containing protein [Chloroflexota bacterium]
MNKEISILEIAKGLSNKEFIFYYQPIISLVTGQISGAEALIRWQKKDGRLIPPSSFIPLAEDTGFISEITQEILPMIFEDLLRINESNKSISVSFNTSAKDFTDTRVVDSISQQLSKCEIEPNRLHVEITETAFLPLDASTTQALFDIRDLGLKIVLNDFSAGHSTFSYLSQLPFSALKIAMPLVQRIGTSKLDFRLLRHLVSLGHQLEYDVIAEGVENAELHRLILSTGCASAQGYYYSHPLPLEDFTSLLNKQPSWVDFPFGLVYLAQFDIVDFSRDTIREALIIYSNQDEKTRQRAKARLPELKYSEIEFAKWYSEIKKYEFDLPENISAIGQEYNQFHKTSIELIQLAEQNISWDTLEQKIKKFNVHSANLSKILVEIASRTLIKSYHSEGNI